MTKTEIETRKMHFVDVLLNKAKETTKFKKISFDWFYDINHMDYILQFYLRVVGNNSSIAFKMHVPGKAWFESDQFIIDNFYPGVERALDKLRK